MPKCTFAAILLLLASGCVLAQQTGTVAGRTPGSAVNRPLKAVQVPVPRPTCESSVTRTLPSGSPVLPDMIFSREMGELICLRHTDGRSEKLLQGGPWQALSPDGKEVAYWLPDSHELHVFSIPNRTDKVLDTFPGAIMGEMQWARTGRVLAYVVRRFEPAGARVIDLDSGRRQLISGASGIVAFPDSEHLITLAWDAVDRVSVATGRRERISAVKYVNQAVLSNSSKLLGLLVSQPTESAATDDEPDCTGGLFALVLQDVQTRKMITVPFPKGFESVLDYEFSPDDRSIAVSFGAAACDYPGDVARVYLVSLPSLSMKPLSPEDRLAVRAHWSPDGKTVIYADFNEGAWLTAVDIRTGKRFRLTGPGNVYDEFLGWR